MVIYISHNIVHLPWPEDNFGSSAKTYKQGSIKAVLRNT